MLINIEKGVHQGIIDMRQLDDHVRIVTSEYDIRIWPRQDSGNVPQIGDPVDPVEGLYNSLLNQSNRIHLSVEGLRESSEVDRVKVIP